MGLRINRISASFPESVLTNEALSKEFEVPVEELFKRTGIRNRFISAKNETASDIATKAAGDLLEAEPGLKQQIDFLIFCTDCFDYVAPATSCILQNRLGLKTSIGCIDLPYGCSGYVYGLAIANGLLHSGMANTILFLTSDTSTKTLNKANLEQRSIFSDAATANIITRNENANPNGFVFGTDGSGALDLYIERSAFRDPADSAFLKETNLQNGQMIMNGINVFSFAIKTVPKLVEETLAKNNIAFKDIDLFIFHQANGFMLETLRKKINIPKDKFYSNIDKVGNTVSSSIPLAIHDAKKEGILKPGMKVLLAGFGVGNSWAATIINF